MKSIIAIIALAFTTYTQATTVTIAPSKDNTLYEIADGSLSNGAGSYFFVGKTNQADGAAIRRALMSFDIAGNIPSGSVITSAELHLTMNKSRGNTQTVSLFPLTTDWGEGSSNATGQEGSGTAATTGDATWTMNFFNSSSWSNPGGDYSVISSADQLISNTGEYIFQSDTMISDIQNWLDTPLMNFGWILTGNESTNQSAQRFASRENPTTSARPSLVVTYEIPETVQFVPVKDNTLYETVDGSTSNGAGGNLYLGLRSNPTDPTRRAVLEFDVSSIHPLSTIIDVQLDLAVTNIPPGAFAGTVSAGLHTLTAEWGEAGSSGSGSGSGAQTGDATWLHTFYNTDTWTTPGGDFTASASATAPFDDTSSNIQFSSTPDLINDIDGWIQNSNNNHGWLIKGDESNAGNVRGVSSREGSTPPVLTIQYLLPPDAIFDNGFEQIMN